jgi:antitoxin ParD1/3/4/toxin ParE1/3/4
MDRRYVLSADAQSDLFEIWCRIAEDSITLANRIEDEFCDLFASLVRMPHQGHVRRDLTSRRVLFFPLYSFLVIYQPDAEVVRIVAVIRGRRNVEKTLKQRSIT